MSTGIDVAACVSGASAVSVSTGGQAVACTASDGTAGTVSVLHLALVDSSGDASPFDYTQAFGFWSLAFTSVLVLYFASQGIGTVVNAIRRL
ncbi:hypothetical protein LGM90_10155 [Burkholderia sp. AU28942]|uniref:hypothetical protein n=1 Tax=Burkholderia TaxID=32008 RepID=UPI0012EA0D49|nr:MULTISPECIES: hypothetical protein [Burkholderia]MCA8308870.1 hypothetical protein [Burkholderia sp. AU28942]QTO51882.1 hypothetical protein J8I86_15530 [Burkholderia latens]